jgi:hypothetical protein
MKVTLTNLHEYFNADFRAAGILIGGPSFNLGSGLAFLIAP